MIESDSLNNQLNSSEGHNFKKREINQVSTKQTAIIAAACSAGCTVVETLCYPFNTVKFRLMTNKEQFVPFFKAARSFYKQEGPSTFFKGYSGVIPCCLVYNFGWFFVYERCNLFQLNLMDKRNLDSEQTERFKKFIPFVSGAVSEILSMFIYIPFNIPKLRMQIDNPKYHYKNLIDGLVRVYKTEGISKFFKTSQMQATAHVFYCGMLMMIYENFRKVVIDRKENKAMNLTETLAVTFLTSTFCSLTMNPFEVIIARFVNHSSRKEKITYTRLIKDLVTKEGFGGFYKGLPGRLIYGLAHSFVYMPIFEHLRRNYGVKIH